MTVFFLDGSQVVFAESFGREFAWVSGPWVESNIYQQNGLCYPKDRHLAGPVDADIVARARAVLSPSPARSAESSKSPTIPEPLLPQGSRVASGGGVR